MICTILSPDSHKHKGAHKIMKNKNSSPTMKDVARDAGVALGTVSKVINGLPVGKSYRLRVEESIRKLNYHVNNYAKGLKSNRTYTIAVIVPNIISPYFSRLVHFLHRELAKRNYQMLLCDTNYDWEREQEHVMMAEQNKVDGIICLSYNTNLQISPNIPFVSIDRYYGAAIPCVASDNYGGGRLAAEKLYENGCRHLAFLRIGSKLTNEPNKRKDGFISACEALGIPYSMKILDDGTPYSEFENFLREHMLNGRLEFDGIFCVTDTLAYQIISTLRSMKIRVPEEVQIIGFDGTRHFGDLDLVCSTIVQPVAEIAANCVNLVLSEDLSASPTLICLPVSYAYGGTTRS